VRITGNVLPSHHSISSKFDIRRKEFANHALKWTREFESLDSTETHVAQMAEKAVDAVKSLEKEVKKLRKQLSAKQSIQSRASRQYKLFERKARRSNEQNAAYKALREARQATRVVRGVLIPEEAALRAAKAASYYWNSVLKGAKAKEKADKEKGEGKKEKADKEKGKEKKERATVATWSRFTVEDSTEYLDVSQLITNCRGKNRQVVFAGTDYGVCKMSETCAQTLNEIKAHVNRYRVLSGE